MRKLVVQHFLGRFRGVTEKPSSLHDFFPIHPTGLSCFPSWTKTLVLRWLSCMIRWILLWYKLYEDMIDHRSYIHNWSSREIKAWKKFRIERDSNPWPLRYRCSALPTELSSQLGAGHIVIAHNIPVDGEECKRIWLCERSYTWTAEKDMKT